MNKTRYLLLLCLIIHFSNLAKAHGAGVDSCGLDVAAFRAELERDGFIVREGMLNRLDLQELFCRNILPSGYAFNFDSPYCVCLIPELPEQSIPPNAPNVYPWTYRLRADEAIVFAGWTPPKVKYFGYQTYLAGRFHPLYKMELRFFVNVGDAINNFTIKTGDGRDGQPLIEPYDAATIIISTPDSGIDARVRKAAVAAGFSESIINTEVIPSQLVRFGLDGLSDELALVNRTAFFSDDPDHHIEDAYFAQDKTVINPDGTLIGPPYQANNRGWVFRVTPAVALETKNLKPFAMPPLRVSGTGDTREYDFLPALEKLRSAIISHFYDPADMEFDELTTWIWIPDGYDQYQRQEYFTLGPCRDTIYLRCGQFQLSQDSSDFVIVYGLNHAMTGKATYSSLVLYSEDPVPGVPAFANVGEMAGVASVNSERTGGNGMRGSAQSFEAVLKEAVPDPDTDPEKFYVWKITRCDREEPYTLRVPDPACPRMQLTKLFVAFRAYVEPETKVAPAWSEVIYDRVIHFHRKATAVSDEPYDRQAAAGDFTLYQNYPNPGNSQTTIEYTVPHRCDAELAIFNLRGQKICAQRQAAEPGRINRFMIDGSGFASGIYFYRIKAGAFAAMKKMQWIN